MLWLNKVLSISVSQYKYLHSTPAKKDVPLHPRENCLSRTWNWHNSQNIGDKSLKKSEWEREREGQRERERENNWGGGGGAEDAFPGWPLAPWTTCYDKCVTHYDAKNTPRLPNDAKPLKDLAGSGAGSKFDAREFLSLTSADPLKTTHTCGIDTYTHKDKNAPISDPGQEKQHYEESINQFFLGVADHHWPPGITVPGGNDTQTNTHKTHRLLIPDKTLS